MSTGRSTQQNRIRVDHGFQLIYPASADTRGRARAVVKGKTYYFGQHATAASYAMFARWKHEFETTGNPGSPLTFRDDTVVFLHSKTKWWQFTGRVASTALIAIACTALGAGGGNWFFSRPVVVQVDGIKLSAREVGYVQALRDTESKNLQVPAGRVAEIFEKISTEGIPDAPPQHITAKPPIVPLD